MCTETVDHPHDRVRHVQTYQVITINTSAPGFDGLGAIYLSIVELELSKYYLLLYVKCQRSKLFYWCILTGRNPVVYWRTSLYHIPSAAVIFSYCAHCASICWLPMSTRSQSFDVCDFRGKLIHEHMLRLVFRIQIMGDARLWQTTIAFCNRSKQVQCFYERVQYRMLERVDKANLRPNHDPNRMLLRQALFHGIIASD